MEFYGQCYGSSRWEVLLEALRKPMRSIALMNKFAVEDDCKRVLGIERSDCSQFLPNYQYGYLHIEEEVAKVRKDETEEGSIVEMSEDVSLKKKALYPWPSPSLPSSLDRNNLQCYYPLDGASIFPVLALNLTPTSKVFDMCAAPGGKSLVILSFLDLLRGGFLGCCDISSSRRLRLTHTFQNYLPPTLSSSIRILSGDASSPSLYHQHPDLFSSSQPFFDRILVDAPCSSERHLLHSPTELAKWSSNRSKVNSKRQFSLLYHALNTCAIPGRVVYSTCSLNPQENDDIVRRVLKYMNKRFQKLNLEKGGEEDSMPQINLVEGESLKIPYGEKTECGWIILPDKYDGMGPIYIATMDLQHVERRRENSSVQKSSKKRGKQAKE